MIEMKNAASNIETAGIAKLKAEGLSVSAHGGWLPVRRSSHRQWPLKWEAHVFRRGSSHRLYGTGLAA